MNYDEGKDSAKEVSHRIEKFVDLGVSKIILFIYPLSKNFELLDEYSKIIEHFK